MLLDWGVESPQSLENFEIGSNQELLSGLTRLADPALRRAGECFVYVWGVPGSGKTHLLRALAQTPAARYIGARAPMQDFQHSPAVSLYLLDDCDQLDDERQIEAFNLFNQAREHRSAMITTGAVAPAHLSVREDLRTRMGWGLIYQVRELSDDEKIAALTHAAQARGLSLSAGVLPYLITHFVRDMRSLSSMLDALDRFSLETKRAITVPLLRELLQRHQTPDRTPSP